MALPIVLPALGAAIAGAASLPAIKKALDNYDAESLKEWFNTHTTGVSNVNTIDNIQKALVLKALENRLFNEEELPKPGPDATIPEVTAQGPGVVVVEEAAAPHGPNEPYRNDDDDENWLDRYRRKRNDHRREKAEIEADHANSAERRLRAEENRAKISRERIAADKAYQEYLRSQGRSIPRPSKSARPITQALPRFFGSKGVSTTNRFYHSPAMGTLEWSIPVGGIVGSGVGIYKNIKNSNQESNADFSNKSDKDSKEISIEYTW